MKRGGYKHGEQWGCECGIQWLCKMRSPGERKIYAHWGAAVAKVSTVGETGPWPFHTTLDCSLASLDKWATVEKQGAPALWKGSACEDSNKTSGRWQAAGVVNEMWPEQVGEWCIICEPKGISRLSWTIQMNSERSLGWSNECEGEDSDSLAGVWRRRLLADRTCRLLMMTKVAGVCVCVQIAHDEVPVSWNVSVRGITHPGNLIEVATKTSLTKNSIYRTSHYVSEAAERSIYLVRGSTLLRYSDSCCLEST